MTVRMPLQAYNDMLSHFAATQTAMEQNCSRTLSQSLADEVNFHRNTFSRVKILIQILRTAQGALNEQDVICTHLQRRHTMNRRICWNVYSRMSQLRKRISHLSPSGESDDPPDNPDGQPYWDASHMNAQSQWR